MAKTVFARPPQKGPVVITNGVSVKLLWQANTVTMSIGLGAQVTAAGPLNPGVAETIFSAVKANTATTAWLALCEPGMNFIGVHVKDLRQAYNPTLASSSGVLPGTGTGNPLAQTTAMAITLRTQQSGRGFVGRVYLMGMVSSVLLNSRQFTTGAGSSTATGIAFIQAVQSIIQTNLGPMALLQKQLLASTVPGAPPPYNSIRSSGAIPITAVNVANPDVDSQRRRVGR